MDSSLSPSNLALINKQTKNRYNCVMSVAADLKTLVNPDPDQWIAPMVRAYGAWLKWLRDAYGYNCDADWILLPKLVRGELDIRDITASVIQQYGMIINKNF